MPTIGVTTSSWQWARPYRAPVEKRGATVRLLLPKDQASVYQKLEGLDALLLTGGADVDPHRYGEEPGPTVKPNAERDEMELPLLREALERDIPILGICRGMQLLNVALGGKLIQDLPDHRAVRQNGRRVSGSHRIFVSPGAKLATILGMGGFMRVNSRHHQGLREAQKAPSLLASAYAVDDGLIEALESPAHSWVVAVQCHPEREEEVPANWGLLFDALVERAAVYASRQAW